MTGVPCEVLRAEIIMLPVMMGRWFSRSVWPMLRLFELFKTIALCNSLSIVVSASLRSPGTVRPIQNTVV